MISGHESNGKIIVVSTDGNFNTKFVYKNFQSNNKTTTTTFDNNLSRLVSLVVIPRLDDLIQQKFSFLGTTTNQPTRDFLVEIIDKLGDESSKAQELQIPITTSQKFQASSYDDYIYIMLRMAKQSLKEIGFIRFGKRDLYFDDGTSLKHIVNCPCILDFYIRFKRCGYGKILFDLVLKQLDVNPQTLAYDRPSYSMLSFLRRHYSLDQPLWQHNHFVIFSGLFSGIET